MSPLQRRYTVQSVFAGFSWGMVESMPRVAPKHFITTILYYHIILIYLITIVHYYIVLLSYIGVL